MSDNGRGSGPWRGLLRRLGVDLRPGEEAAAALLFGAFVLLFNFHYAAKSIRQATFVDSLGAERLPWVYLLVALCAYPLLRLYGRLTERVAYPRLVASTFLVVAASMVVFWWALRDPRPWETMVLYVWLAIVFGLTVSQLWMLSSQVLDTRQARRLFGLVGAGALLGSVAGGQLARIASAFSGTRDALLVAAVPLLGSAALVVLAGRRQPSTAGDGPGVRDEAVESRGGLKDVLASRHLQLIALILTASVVIGQVVDLQFNWAVERATRGLDQRTAFFGNLYSVSGIAAFAFQLLLTSRIHRVLGVAAAMRIMPLAMAVGSGGLLLVAGFAPAALLPVAFGLKIGENGLRYSLEQSTRELLFLPVPAAVRLRAKAFIDVFVQRIAKGIAALALLPVTFGVLSAVEAGWIAIVLSVVWLAATRSVQREYVRCFRSGLRDRKVDATLPIKISDATTLELLIQSLGSPDPRQVLNSLEVLSAHGRGNLVLPLLLHHDDASVRRRTLEILGEVGRRDAVPLIERRLRDPEPEVRALAIRVLAQLSGRDLCELMLPRLEEGHPEVRAAAVACLIQHGGEETRRPASRVLQQLLSDADPAVRAEAAKALSGIPDPIFQEHLVRLLFDENPRVVRQAIHAVRNRASGDAMNPIYLPILVGLLAKRRLKHDAREALVALGEPAIPALVHFMGDPEENLWVKRALPKAVARIGTPAAAEGLLDCLVHAHDAFLRRKLIEALAGLPHRPAGRRLEQVHEQVVAEVRGYLTSLRDLSSLGSLARVRFDGPAVRWADASHDPSLLEQLLIEGMDDHLGNAFGLLALTHEPEHVWPAYRGLTASRRPVRAHALEFLDNTLRAEIRRDVFLAIDDVPVADKLAGAAERFGIVPRSAPETLAEFIALGEHANDRSSSLAAAAAYAVYAERLESLYPALERSAREAVHPFVRETSAWAVGRIRPARASQPTEGA